MAKAKGSGLSTGMLERQLGIVSDELARTKRALQEARDGAVQVPVVTPGQLAELRAISTRLSDDAAAARALSDSVEGWITQLEKILSNSERSIREDRGCRTASGG